MIRHKNAIIILLALVCVIGAVVGYKYLKFTKENPTYCAICHLTQEGYNSHNTSAHYNIICQRCHSMTAMEGNKLIMARYVKGDKKVNQSHGSVRPWQSCVECHDSDVAQGSVTFRKSYGHARHVFMHNINCSSCHSGQLHSFQVTADKCNACHQDKLIHGMGTTGTYCLNCHTFTGSAERTMQPSEKCSKCHTDLKTSEIMKEMACHDCHKPHNKLKLNSIDCLSNCHSSETRVGQHAIHINLGTLECTDCHKPHSWEVTKKNAKGICDKCHRLKDPATFIY